MRKLFKLLSLILLVVLINCALVGCGTLNNVSNELENENLIEHKLSYVVIRINPQIELVIDAEEKVVATNAVNADGEVVLSELKLIGLSCEDAVLAITEKAIELGYIDVTAEENIVYVLAESETDEEEKGLEDKLCGKIDKFFNEKGMHGKGKLEDLEEYKSLAEEWGVSLKLAKLISRVTELYPEMNIEEILELSKKELCELVKDENHKHGIPAQIRDEYKEQVEAIKEEFSRYFELKKELKKLEKQLKDESLTEEEKASLQSDYDVKLFEYETLKAEYETKLKEIKESCKEEIDKVKDEIKEEANDRFKKIEKYKTLAEEWNVTLYKAILISKILESNPELTLEEVLSLSNEELKELLGANCPEKKEKPENGKPEKDEDLENGNPDVEEEQLEDNKPNKEDKPENNKQIKKKMIQK